MIILQHNYIILTICGIPCHVDNSVADKRKGVQYLEQQLFLSCVVQDIGHLSPNVLWTYLSILGPMANSDQSQSLRHRQAC